MTTKKPTELGAVSSGKSPSRSKPSMSQHIQPFSAADGAKGRGLTKIEKVRRIERTEEMMLSVASMKTILNTLQQEFQISQRQVYKHIARVRKRWESDSIKRGDLKQRRIDAIRRLEESTDAARAVKDMRSVVAFEKLRAQIEGTLSPTKNEHTVDIKDLPHPSTLTDAQLAAAKAAIFAGRDVRKAIEEA